MGFGFCGVRCVEDFIYKIYMKSSVFDSFVVFIILVKVLFFIFSVLEILIEFKKIDSVNEDLILYWKVRMEFIFVICMAIVCIFLFNPFYGGTLVVDYHVRYLLFIYGFIILTNSRWETLFGEMPPWFQMIQRLF